MRNIGKYQVQGELGRGGFGTVYRAWDPVVNRAVAIKVLTVQGDDDLLTRFRNEAAAAGNLHHRNIVTIHDFGEHNGVPYMVMQLLEGHTLQEVLTRKLPFSLIQKMNIMGQVAEGLHHAHMHGIVHRDVKPPNIMVLPDESVQIMDFGIARLTASTSRQTRTGFVIGTVLYMAPEQFLQNKVVDHRADIWAYGTIYYELLTGRHPFAAAEETSVLYQVAHVDPPPLRSVAPDCPQALEDVISRLLQKDPDFRYQNLKELQFDVQPILVELKREHAGELVAEVRQLTGDGRLEEAQAAAQRILELDPSNREAQTLLQQLRQRLQRRLIQPRITALLQKAEQDVQAREFQPAIECLEGALRLTGTDPAIEARLGQIRNLLEHSRRSERLVVEAQREMRAQNFTAAFRIASEAAQTDPGNTSASHLISQIQHELDVRERHRLLEQGISRARGLLLLQQFEEAIVALDELASEFPDDANVGDLLAAARREKQQQERLERRRKEISQIRDTLRQHRFESGITTLEMLLAEFPGDTEIKQLLSFARDEWQSYKRGQALSKTRAEADRLCGDARFDEALSLVEGVLTEYPADASLVRLVQSVSIARTEFEERERSTAVRNLLQQANEAERKGDVAGALRILEQGLHEYDNAEALAAAASRLRPIVAHQERREAMARHSSAIEAAIAAADYSRALALIESGRREFPGERAFDAFASRVVSSRTAAELDMARARVRKEISEGRRDLALELIAVAMKRFPGDVQLAAMERETRAAIAAAEQQARVERETREAADRQAAEERRAHEQAERNVREETERKAREGAERKAREEADRKAREEAERKAREEAERIAAEQRSQFEAERKAREEAERLAAEHRAHVEAERKAREEAERLAAAERAERERERKVREEMELKSRAEVERFAAEQRAHVEAERKAREEAERLAAAERAERERERKSREEHELKSREESARLAAEQRAEFEAERKARQESERRAAEDRQAWETADRKSREEAERKAAEQRAHFEAERKAREEAERVVADERAERERERKAREEVERKGRQEAAALAALGKAEADAERKARQEAERVAAEERKAREAAERKAREESARRSAEDKSRLEAERKAREDAERRAAEERAQFERERKAREEADRKAHEESERRAAEQRVQLERERKGREEAEKRAAEERARNEKERKAREEAEKKARRKEGVVAVATAGGAAAAPAPIPETRRSAQVPLYFLGAGVAVLLLIGGIVMFKSGQSPAQPSAQQEPQSSPTAANNPPVTQPSSGRAPLSSTDVPPVVSAAKAKPEPAKLEPVKAEAAKAAPPKQDPRDVAASRPPAPQPSAPQAETAAASPPPVQPPPTRPSDSPASRVVGDSGGRPSVVSQSPPVAQPQPAEPRGPWRGKMSGKLAWSGQLPAGGRVTLNTQRVVDGPGELVSIDLLPGFTEVEITGVRPNGRISVAANGPNSLSITNTGSEAANFIEVTWRVKQ